jgi:phosphate transport system permease protein
VGGGVGMNMRSSADLLRPKRIRWGELIIHFLLILCALISIVTTVGIVFVLLDETVKFFAHVSIVEFLTETTWTAWFNNPKYGVLPLVNGTFLVAAGAGIIAIPLGLLSAIYLSEYASRKLRGWLKPILEVLAGIPTVVYGYFAVTTVTPILQKFIPQTQVFNAASASIVVGIMILPTVASLCDDAFAAVPKSLRDAGFSVGATKFEVAKGVVLPAALSGVFASFVLALARAIGETMAVAMAAGATPKMTLNPLESVQTMTSYIVQVSLGDTPHGTVVYQSIFAVGFLLFLITLGMNIVSHWVIRRYRETYE